MRNSLLFSLLCFGITINSLQAGTDQPTTPVLRFAIAGDVMVHETQLQAAFDANNKTYDFQNTFSLASSLFNNVDVAIANLETTLPGKEFSGYPAFGAPDQLIDAVKGAGINLLTTANNHCLDKGKAGMRRTLRVLDEKGIAHLGTYATEEEYLEQRVFLLKQNGMTVALLNYTYGTNEIPTPSGTHVNRIDLKQIQEDITFARKSPVDAVMVLFHFGTEYLNQPDAFQRSVVDATLKAGVDIVIGGHPHHVQPYKQIFQKNSQGELSQRLIAYSLGNFVSSQRQAYRDGGMVLYFTLSKQTAQTGMTHLSITDISHQLVWVEMEHQKDQRRYRIIPIESASHPSNPFQLSPASLEGMNRYQENVTTVLNTPLTLERSNQSNGARE